MNKKSGQRTTISRRVIASLLCCVCLLGAMPLAAIATETEETQAVTIAETTAQTEAATEAATLPAETDPAGTEEGDILPSQPDNGETLPYEPEATEPKEQTFYEKLRAAESCQAMYDLLENAPLADVEALTDEQLTALIDYANGLPEEECKEELIFDLTALKDGDAEIVPGEWNGGGNGSWNPSGDGENECDQSYYQASAQVFYDTMTYNRSTQKGSSYSAGRNMIEKVELTSKNVVQKDATNPKNASGGTKMNEYFSGATTTNEVTSTLKITPKAGYYVTDVVIACTGPQSSESAFSCNTWSEGNAFNRNFNVGTGGSVSIDVSSKDFSHRSKSGKVFILIAVAPIPTPLYVEYWPGNITNYVGTSNTIFQDSDGWTVQGTGNELGIGLVDTSYTQFKYAYQTGSSGDAKNWKHYANGITDEAKTAAANVGYYFTGWKVEYYTSYNVQSGNTVDDRNFTYNLTEAYGEGVNKQPGDAVDLVTNCKIIAQWAPIQLEMTKTVEGLSNIDEHKNAQKTYKLTLQKLNADGTTYDDLQTVDYTITGDGTLTYTFGASGAHKTQVITPGTYKVVENGTYDLTGTSKNAYCTTSYPAETVTVGMDGTAPELKVLNTYSETPATTSVSVNKVVDGNVGDRNKAFPFTVKVDKKMTAGTYNAKDGSVAYKVDDDGTGSRITFQLANGQKVVLQDVPIGAKLEITESNNADYQVTVGGKTLKDQNVNTDATHTVDSVTKDMDAITFTNTKEVTIDTGISLETLPYILILAVVAVGAVVMIRKRRERDED